LDQREAETVSIVTRVPVGAAASGDGPIVVCPCLAGLPADLALRMSILPVHDANAWLDAADVPDIPPSLRDRLYFGVFALDRLRSRERILARLVAKGVPGVVNLPSVSFFDGQAGRTLGSLGFGPSDELDFLRAAGRTGLRIAFCAPPGAGPLAPSEPHPWLLLRHDIASGRITVAGP